MYKENEILNWDWRQFFHAVDEAPVLLLQEALSKALNLNFSLHIFILFLKEGPSKIVKLQTPQNLDLPPGWDHEFLIEDSFSSFRSGDQTKNQRPTEYG